MRTYDRYVTDIALLGSHAFILIWRVKWYSTAKWRPKFETERNSSQITEKKREKTNEDRDQTRTEAS